VEVCRCTNEDHANLDNIESCCTTEDYGNLENNHISVSEEIMRTSPRILAMMLSTTLVVRYMY
jgi:hypothetical protein